MLYRAAYATAFGASIAVGRLTPGLEFCRDVTDGECEAIWLKAQFDAANRSGGGH